jgi:hypothetical protein
MQPWSYRLRVRKEVMSGLHTGILRSCSPPARTNPAPGPVLLGPLGGYPPNLFPPIPPLGAVSGSSPLKAASNSANAIVAALERKTVVSIRLEHDSGQTRAVTYFSSSIRFFSSFSFSISFLVFFLTP